MKIQLASDLHLEMLVKRSPRTRIIDPVPEADLLVLAGDIHSATKAIDVFGAWPVPVLYVAGNHEFYSERWEPTRAAIREAAAGTSVRFLDNDALELGGVRFFGCTLWTDFNLPGASQTEWMREVGRGLNDYLAIRTERGRLRPYQTLEDHEQSRAWLEIELAKPFHGKTVVVTHHGPHQMSIHPRYAGDRLNAGFVSDLTPLLDSADLWLHGHIHDSIDYRVGRCRVVANPAGYALNSFGVAADMKLGFENQFFNPRLVSYTLDLG
jgi:predicted phosphodiesterase